MGDYVVPPESRLETPPDGDNGEIVEVEFDRADERYAKNPPKACQSCESPVDQSEPHVWAYGWQMNPYGNRTHFRAVFCDRDCWTAWASRE